MKKKMNKYKKRLHKFNTLTGKEVSSLHKCNIITEDKAQLATKVFIQA